MSEQKIETRGRKPVSEISRLSKKQWTFVNLYCDKQGELTLREIAQEAGYAATSAHTRAYELLNPRLSPHVVKAIRERRAELAEKYGIDFGRHMRDLQRIRDTALNNGAYSAAVQAEFRRGQAANMYVTRSEVLHGSIDQMSKADVEKALNEVKKQLGQESTEKVIEGEVLDTRSDVLETVEERLLGLTSKH